MVRLFGVLVLDAAYVELAKFVLRALAVTGQLLIQLAFDLEVIFALENDAFKNFVVVDRVSEARLGLVQADCLQLFVVSLPAVRVCRPSYVLVHF